MKTKSKAKGTAAEITKKNSGSKITKKVIATKGKK